MRDRTVDAPPLALRALAIGGTAGAVVALPDLTRVIASGEALGAVGLVAGLLLAAYVAVGAVVGVAVGLALRAAPRQEATRALAFGVAVGLALAVVSPEIFRGARVSRTWLGPVGPYLLPYAGLVGATLAAHLAQHVARRPSLARALAAAGLVVSVGLSGLHQHQVCRYYPEVGVGLSLAAGVLAAWSALQLLPGVQRSSRLFPVLFALAVLALVPSPPEALRVALAHHPLGATTLLGPLLAARSDRHVVEVEQQDLDARFATLASARAGEPSPLVGRTRGMNVLFVLVDTLRADRWEDAAGFPTFARFRRECVAFTRAFAAGSSTRMSVTSLMRGTTNRAPQREPELLRAFAAADYEMGAVLPAVVWRILEDELDLSVLSWRRVIGRDDGSWGGGIAEPTGLEVADSALALIDAQRDDGRPWFVWSHFFSAHQWMLLTDEGTAAERYDEALRDDAAGIDRLLEGVRERGLDDSTVVVFLADHGESLGAHGWETHSVWLFSELLHVPLAVCAPGLEPREVATQQPLIALGPTLTELAGIDAHFPPEAPSLLPSIGDRTGEPSDWPILMRSREQRAVLIGGHLVRFTHSTHAVESLVVDEALREEHRPNLYPADRERTHRALEWLGVHVGG